MAFKVSSKEQAELLRRAESLGARVFDRGRGHLKVFTPNGATVICSRTASDRRSHLNLRRDLRVIGGLDL